MGAIEKSLHASTALKTFAIVFGFATAALYVLCDMLGWPLFTYHPATNQLEWFRAPPRKGEGPVMYWCGWTVSAIQGAAALGVLTTLLPDNVTRKIPLALVRIVPVLAIPLLVYSLMPLWTRQWREMQGLHQPAANSCRGPNSPESQGFKTSRASHMLRMHNSSTRTRIDSSGGATI